MGQKLNDREVAASIEFSQALEKARVELEMSFKDFYSVLKIYQASWRKLLKGKIRPSERTKDSAKEALGVNFKIDTSGYDKPFHVRLLQNKFARAATKNSH